MFTFSEKQMRVFGGRVMPKPSLDELDQQTDPNIHIHLPRYIDWGTRCELLGDEDVLQREEADPEGERIQALLRLERLFR